jgi:HK97 family phage major capsid protein
MSVLLAEREPDPVPDPIPSPEPDPPADPAAWAWLTRAGVHMRDGEAATASYGAFLTQRREAAQAVLDTILDTAHGEARDLTTDEAATVEARRADVLRLAPQITAATERDQRRAAEVAAMRSAAGRQVGAGTLADGSRVSITRPEPVYGPGSAFSYFRDAFHAGRDVDAAARLARHRAGLVELVTEAERQGRGINTANLAGAIPTEYYPDLYVDDIDYTGPMSGFFASTTITDSRPIIVPSFGTVTGDTGQPASENAALPNVDVTTAPLTGTPIWVGGESIVSRQAVDGASPGTDRIIAAELRQLLMRDRERAIAAIIAALTAAGSVDATGGATEGAEGLILHRGIRKAVAKFGTARHLPAEVVFASSDTWELLNAAEDTAGRPVMPVGDYVNSSGQAQAGLMAGRIAGVQTLPAWGLAAKTIATARANDAHIWQSAVLDVTLTERNGPHSVVFAVAQYFLALVLQPAGVKRWTWTGAAPAGDDPQADAEAAGSARGKSK